MPSIIQGFEYDIFISYRQKDNKGERWVTNFVEALKTELDSTFKEEISVYFDVNPCDGLLETHDIHASLRQKLKCAVFIPVISRTYCDPNSFAWANELVAFIDQANQDDYGMKVKLQGGNVASRVLPIQIHDLDPEDRYLLEKELGGVMRGIEFIYKEPGVNRPLTNEDDEKINLNRTKYRNQINKVANAIKEIIEGLRTDKKTSLANKELSDQQKNLFLKGGYLISRLRREAKRAKLRNAIIIFLSALLLAAATFITLRFKSMTVTDKKTDVIEKSIAVLPFRNVSEDQNQENICDGLTIEIIDHLYKIKSFDKVVSAGSVFTYKRTNKKIPQIAEELKVNYILDGSYRKVGDKVRVIVQLIDPKTDKILWPNEYDKPFRELIDIQADIALQIAGQIKAFITSSEKQNINKRPTSNQEAYELIQSGLYIWNTRNFTRIDQLLEMAQKAINLDPNYADAYAYAGLCTLLKASVWGGSEIRMVIRDASSYLEKALEIDPDNCPAHLGLAMFNDWIIWNYPKAEKEFREVLELEPNNPQYAELYVEFLLKMDHPVEALSHKINTEQSYRLIQAGILSDSKKEINSSIKAYLDAQGIKGLKYAGDCYLWKEQYDSARFYLESAIKAGDTAFMGEPRFQAYLALAYYKTNQKDKAKKMVGKITSMCKVTSTGSPEYFAGWYYSGAGKADSAFYWLDIALKNRSNQLAWLKVDPVFKNIRADRRYADLYQKTGHKAYDDFMSTLKKK